MTLDPGITSLLDRDADRTAHVTVTRERQRSVGDRNLFEQLRGGVPPAPELRDPRVRRRRRFRRVEEPDARPIRGAVVVQAGLEPPPFALDPLVFGSPIVPIAASVPAAGARQAMCEVPCARPPVTGCFARAARTPMGQAWDPLSLRAPSYRHSLLRCRTLDVSGCRNFQSVRKPPVRRADLTAGAHPPSHVAIVRHRPTPPTPPFAPAHARAERGAVPCPCQEPSKFQRDILTVELVPPVQRQMAWIGVGEVRDKLKHVCMRIGEVFVVGRAHNALRDAINQSYPKIIIALHCHAVCVHYLSVQSSPNRSQGQCSTARACRSQDGYRGSR
jgi:hypothetical protein